MRDKKSTLESKKGIEETRRLKAHTYAKILFSKTLTFLVWKPHFIIMVFIDDFVHWKNFKVQFDKQSKLQIMKSMFDDFTSYLPSYLLPPSTDCDEFLQILFHFRLQIKLASFEIPFGNSAFGLLCRFCDWHRILLWKWKNCRQRMKGIRKRRERKRVGERKRKRERNCQIDMC